jgi:hypothetical protein
MIFGKPRGEVSNLGRFVVCRVVVSFSVNIISQNRPHPCVTLLSEQQ